MAKEPQTGNKPPGEGIKKPPAGKLPTAGGPGTRPTAKPPAPKTQLAKAVRATTLKASPVQPAAESEIRNKPVAVTKPALRQETEAAVAAKDQTRLPTMTKPVPAGGNGTAASPAAKPTGGAEKSASVLGEFKLLKKLGQGGMGAVYKAQHTKDNRIVAVKVLAKELSGKADFVKRFERESRVMAKLDHPHVLRCMEVGKHNDYHYLAMEYVEGGSVEGWLKKLGRFSIGDALHIILKTAAGLQHAHDKSLIHRDIKPDNILLTGDGVVKVADLGLAKDTEEDVALTKTGAGAGTPIYMAPEQARDVKHVDSRVDIYALGVMLYVFLTGQPPFPGTTLVEVIAAKEKGKFDPIRRHNDEVPSKIDLIVDKMLARDPKHRYASCTDVIGALAPLQLANDYLSFLGPAGEAGAVAAEPAKPSSEFSTQLAKKKPAGPTKAPGASAGATKAHGIGAAKTNIADEKPVEKDVWYVNMKTPKGQIVNKKVTTDQLRTLIKSGGIDADAECSKTANSGFRSIATFQEFHSLFRSKDTAGKAKAKASQYDDMYKKLAKAQERRERWRGVKRFMSGTLGRLLGLLWIVLILGLIGLGIWLLFTRVLA